MAIMIAGKAVGPVGFGMASLMHPGRVKTEDAIKVLKAAFDAGSNLWNAGEHYGTANYNSLHLLDAYFTKYPDHASEVVVSVKGCLDASREPAVDAKSVTQSIERCLKILDGKCRIDIFQPARLSHDVALEETVSAIAEYVKAGAIGAVGLSECSGESIRKASTITALASVEVELSLFETGIYDNGVSAACKEHSIPITAYSPISRGFLTGQIRRYEDMAENDYRKSFPRFAKDNFDNNVIIVHVAESIAKKHGCSVVQVALAWVIQQSGIIGVPVIPIPGTASAERIGENTAIVTLGREALDELRTVLKKVEIKGSRYPANQVKLLSI